METRTMRKDRLRRRAAAASVIFAGAALLLGAASAQRANRWLTIIEWSTLTVALDTPTARTHLDHWDVWARTEYRKTQIDTSAAGKPYRYRSTLELHSVDCGRLRLRFVESIYHDSLGRVTHSRSYPDEDDAPWTRIAPQTLGEDIVRGTCEAVPYLDGTVATTQRQLAQILKAVDSTRRTWCLSPPDSVARKQCATALPKTPPTTRGPAPAYTRAIQWLDSTLNLYVPPPAELPKLPLKGG
jgi:hypothetical protein